MVTDKTGWTVFEPVICECVNTHTGQVKTPGGVKPVFILELISLNSEELELVKFFNVNITPSGNYSVKHNSDFAKLYRLAIGKNPAARFSRADQLLQHFLGYKFIAEFKESKTSNDSKFLKVTQLKPLSPIVSDSWFKSGKLRGIQRGRYNKLCNTARQEKDNLSTISKQKCDNDLSKENASKIKPEQLSGDISTTYKDKEYRVEPLPLINTMIKNGKEKVITYSRSPAESVEEYLDRVIENSL